MSTQTTLKTRRVSLTTLSKKINLLSNTISLQIPIEDYSGINMDSQPMKSIWTDEELDILKTKLLDLSTQL